MKIAFCLNGENRTEEVAGGEMLIDLLRDRLHVRSVKRGGRAGKPASDTAGLY